MNPHQKNKIDLSTLSSDEQRLFRLYGKLPNKKDLLQNKLKERKYFDSGDYALSKAGKASDSGVTSIGTEHPTADGIPHASPLAQTVSRQDSVNAGSPPTYNHNMPSLSASSSHQGSVDVSSPGLSGPSPAGMHRGSINGIPGGGMPGIQTTGINTSRSPAKESYLARSASAEDEENKKAAEQAMSTTNPGAVAAQARAEYEGSVSPPPKTEGIPIRK